MNEPRLPDALIIGPTKTGTTWIHRYMGTRNDIRLPSGVKETFFFDHHWDRGIAWYENRFSRPEPNEPTRCLEIGSSYFHKSFVPGRVWATLGNIPLLATLRDPSERSWSHYLHLRRYGHTKVPLRQAVQTFPEILDASRYRTCLQHWYAHFPGENIHFLWQDLLAASPMDYAEAVCRALGIAYRPVPEELHGKQNAASLPSSLLLAQLGYRISRFMRRMGFYKTIDAAGNLGLKRIFYGKPGSAEQVKPTPEEAAWLARQLAGEIPSEAEAARRVQMTTIADRHNQKRHTR